MLRPKILKIISIITFSLCAINAVHAEQNVDKFSYKGVKFGDTEEKLIKDGYTCRIKNNLKRICEKEIEKNLNAMILIKDNIVYQMSYLGESQTDEKCSRNVKQIWSLLTGAYGAYPGGRVGARGGFISGLENRHSYRGSLKDIREGSTKFINYNATCIQQKDESYTFRLSFMKAYEVSQ